VNCGVKAAFIVMENLGILRMKFTPHHYRVNRYHLFTDPVLVEPTATGLCHAPAIENALLFGRGPGLTEANPDH